MNYSECIENARTRIGNYCKACPECNGRACKNQMPGPGAKGIGDTAIRNYDKWKEIRVQMDTIAENKLVDTSLELFGKKFLYPFFAGPVGAVGLHYGDCLDDVRYNDILVSACAKYGIAAFTGDGLDSNVMVAATKAIGKTDGILKIILMNFLREMMINYCSLLTVPYGLRKILLKKMSLTEE